MKTKLVLILATAGALCALAPPAAAIPADPNQRFVLRQPDGTRVLARKFGDEYYHGYETLSGHTIVRGASGQWLYARKTAKGRLAAGDRPAHLKAPRAAGTHLRDVVSARAGRAAQLSSLQPRIPGAPGDPRINTPAFPATGTHRQLVILAAYSNTNQVTAPSDWTSRFFGATNSLKHFYEVNSYQTLTFAPAAETSGTYADGIVGWLKINTIAGPTGYQWANVGSQVIAAIRESDRFVNFAQYDTSPRDGYLAPHELHVTIIAAGEEQSLCTGGVWGHKNSMGAAAPTLDGVRVGYYGYTIFGEIQCGGGAHQATMGIIAHELGHDLGMPDLYDVDKSSQGGLDGGVGYWSLMSYGSHNRAAGGFGGSSPANVDGPLKSYMGWVVPEQVTGPVNSVLLQQSATSARAVRLRANPNGFDWRFGYNVGSGEYFLLENRQRVGYDVGLPNCGVLVWHVAEQAPSGSPNANEAGVRLVDLEEGDGGSSPFNAADVWPSTKDFDDNSTPNARLYSGQLTGVRVKVVSTSCAATMTVNTADGSAAPGVPNDNFAAATNAPTLPYAQTGIATASATKQVGEQSPTCDPTIGRTVWWRFTPQTNMRVKAETTGSSYDTVLAAWTGTTLGALTEQACNDDPAGGPAGVPSSFELNLTAGTTYFFQAGGFGAIGGTLNFSLSRVTTAPANDNFANAPGISDALPFERTAIQNVDATLEAGEPQPACATGTGKTVWFRFTPTANTLVKAETTGSNFDTVLAAYSGTTLGALTPVACNDDLPGGGSGPSSFQASLTAGVTYYFQAGGFNNAGVVGSGNLNFKLSRVATGPANDNFAGASAVGALPYSASGSNADATVEASEPTPTCGAIGRTVWYRFVPATTMSVVAETTDSSSPFDTVLAAYRGTALGALTEVGCSDDVAAAGGPSRIQLTLSAGQTYYFQAGGFKGGDTVAQGTLAFKLTAVATTDVFAGAFPIAIVPFSQTGTTTSATVEGGEPTPTCAAIGKTVWYSITPAGNMTVTLSTQGSAFDTVLAVYRGTSIGALTEVGCNDDGIATGGASRIISLALLDEQTYYIQVGGYKNLNTTASGAYTLSVTGS